MIRHVTTRYGDIDTGLHSPPIKCKGRASHPPHRHISSALVIQYSPAHPQVFGLRKDANAMFFLNWVGLLQPNRARPASKQDHVISPSGNVALCFREREAPVATIYPQDTSWSLEA